MTRTTPTPLLAALAFALLSTAAFASGGDSAAPAPSVPAASPEQMAIDNYNAGIELRAKALEIDEEIAGQSNAKKIAKLEAKREKAFEKAAALYQAAIKDKPDFAQAHGSLGYALRRLGRFEEAMAAYDQALELNPNYPAAIEYRAEALLGLGRFDEVKQAYQRLSMMSADHAAELMAAVKVWSAEQANAEAAAAAGLTEWMAGQERVATETASGGQSGKQRWR